MKQLTLLVATLFIAGASFACDGDKGKKACCKKGENKEAKACCKKGASKDCKGGDHAKTATGTEKKAS